MGKNKTIEEICADVKKFIFENYLFGYDEKDLNEDSSFLELGVLDSTGIMELVALIESEYGVEVLDSEIIPENLDSINCISRYVYKKLNSSAEG